MNKETEDRVDAYFREAGIGLSRRARTVLVEMICMNGDMSVTDDSYLSQPLRSVNSALAHLIDHFGVDFHNIAGLPDDDFLDYPLDFPGPQGRDLSRQLGLSMSSDEVVRDMHPGRLAAEIRGFSRSNLSLHRVSPRLGAEFDERVQEQLNMLHRHFGDDILFLVSSYALTAKKSFIDTYDLIHISMDLPFTGAAFLEAGASYFDVQKEVDRFASLDDRLDQQRLILTVEGQRISVKSFSLLDGYRHEDRKAPPSDLLVHLTQSTAVVPQQVLIEFEELINWSGASEEDIHRFLSKHPSLILGDRYTTLRSKLVLEQGDRGDLIPDFFAELASSGYADIVELKLPSEPLIVGTTNRRRLSSAVHSAAAQLRTYSNYFDNRANRNHFYTRFGLRAFRPNLAVIIGRAPQPDLHEDFLEAKSALPSIDLLTYDEIIARARRRVLTMLGPGAVNRPSDGRR